MQLIKLRVGSCKYLEITYHRFEKTCSTNFEIVTILRDNADEVAQQQFISICMRDLHKEFVSSSQLDNKFGFQKHNSKKIVEKKYKLEDQAKNFSSRPHKYKLFLHKEIPHQSSIINIFQYHIFMTAQVNIHKK